RSASMPVLLYEMTQFSIWGGEDLVKPAVGDTRPFAGWDWMNQVTPGDFQSDTFDGYFYEGMQPLELCQADRSSISSPALDNLCLRAPVPDPPPPPPGDIDIINLNVYPEMTSTYIAVAVPTSIIKQPAIVKQGGIIVAPAEIYGNISAIAVVEITAFDTATGGSGIIRDIVADGVQLFTALRYTGPSTMTRETPVTVTARLVTTQDRVALANKTITFTLGTVTVTATTKLDGTATATMTLPATESTGSRTMTITFAGAGTEPAASITAPITVQ
ncbi:MAG: Ig-like domain-containing protein, partial [Thermoanaerobaculia bacterium]